MNSDARTSSSPFPRRHAACLRVGPRLGQTPDPAGRPDANAERPPSSPAGEWKTGALGSGFSVDQACGAVLIAEMSKLSLTLSLTITPPVSSAAFQVRPQSERRMFVLPSKPMRSLP